MKIKHALLLVTIFFQILFFSSYSFSTVQSKQPETTQKAAVIESYGKLPLSFIENRGQMNKEIAFALKGRQGDIYFTKEGVVFSLISKQPSKTTPLKDKKSKNVKRLSFTMKPVGANMEVKLTAEKKLPGKVNYLTGNDPKKWQTNVPLYKEICYKNIYSGIDLKVYGTNNQMEYDFIVSPGSNPKDINVAFEGIDSLGVDKNGNLIIKTATSDLKHLKPVIYQQINGKRISIDGEYKVAKNNIGFEIKEYNKNYTLIIDPVTFSYSTYLGGSDHDYAKGIAIDSSGNVYIAGETWSGDFPTLNAYQGAYGGGYSDAFITKLDAGGTALLYSTYLGGDDIETAYDIAIDTYNNAYITGSTSSDDFPTHNAFQTALGGSRDAFVTKIGPNGDTLVYSTYLGGDGNDDGRSIAIDVSGIAYVAGYVSSDDFPVVNAYQGTLGGSSDAFVSKLNPGGNTLSYSTYLGGGDAELASDIAIDTSNNVYITGVTTSTDFPTQNAYQVALGGEEDAFITKIGSNGDTLVYSTYLGGSLDEEAKGIIIDVAGNAYITGVTGSDDFPTLNAYQNNFAGDYSDAFITKIGISGDNLIFSTYFGGAEHDIGNDIAVDASGSVYIAGYSESDDFPFQYPLEYSFDASSENGFGFVTKFDPTGTTLSYSTYLGNDGVIDIAIDSSENVYVTGSTEYDDHPVFNPYQQQNNGRRDAFISKLTFTAGGGDSSDEGDSGGNGGTSGSSGGSIPNISGGGSGGKSLNATNGEVANSGCFIGTITY